MLHLGEFIDTLAALPADMPVQMRGETGLGFVSWRGVYAEPSLDHGWTTFGLDIGEMMFQGFTYTDAGDHDRREPANTVGELLAVAKDLAAGGNLCGYKGGWYPMHRGSPLHADPYGECPGSGVIAVKVSDGVAVIEVHERTYGDD